MATTSQSERHKAYIARKAKELGIKVSAARKIAQDANDDRILTFSQWNWRDRNLSKARKARGGQPTVTKAKGTTAVDAVKNTRAQRVADELVRINGRVAHRVDLTEVKNGLCITLDQADLTTAMKALSGYKVRHGKGEGYVSKRGARERIYTASANVVNMRKALVGAGLQPTF